MANRHNQPPNCLLETHLFRHGVVNSAGLDEAGRGAWAGPVTAAAVILPPPDMKLENQLDGLRDSKQLSAAKREHWDREIRTLAIAVCVGQATVEEIDGLGILPATRLAMWRAVDGLETTTDHLLIDYILIGDIGINQTALPHGDARVTSIAAASVVAKVARDHFMIELDRQYPAFGFAQHKGYGTFQHQQALARLGPSPIHRRSFEPVRNARTHN
ncbi:MAG: ribonuclease HII [Anaerolineales bacterium]|nr:MAG: ribonuclease HII [Anaerolineales bacterium]